MNERNKFREKLEQTKEFVITAELVPDVSSRSRKAERVLKFAKEAAADGVLDALTITDNPGGSPSLSPDVLGLKILEEGIDPIVHMTCRDSTRFGLYSRASQLDAMGIRNILALTGDGPADSRTGTAKPCFDLDSVTLLHLLNSMKKDGSPYSALPADANHADHRSDFYLGAAVSSQKSSESEQMTQYYKLVRKIQNGAQYIITQLSYDARKFEELLMFTKSQGVDVPVLASIYRLTKPVVNYMRTKGVPGVYISNGLYETIIQEAESADKGRYASIVRTAKLMAILNGLGYRGAHLSGYHLYEDIKTTLDCFYKFKDDWKEFLGEFDHPHKDGYYLYKKDESTGMNSNELSEPAKPTLGKTCSMGFYEWFHNVFFCNESALYPVLKKAADFIDKYSVLRSCFFIFERMAKITLFRCQNCGDCALGDMAYYCPESQCPKYTRNGPCGGSKDTHCEMRPERYCVWVSAYRRLNSLNKSSELMKDFVSPRNWALNETSSWLNFYLGKDHSAIMASMHDGSEGANKSNGKK